MLFCTSNSAPLRLQYRCLSCPWPWFNPHPSGCRIQVDALGHTSMPFRSVLSCHLHFLPTRWFPSLTRLKLLVISDSGILQFMLLFKAHKIKGTQISMFLYSVWKLLLLLQPANRHLDLYSCQRECTLTRNNSKELACWTKLNSTLYLRTNGPVSLCPPYLSQTVISFSQTAWIYS